MVDVAQVLESLRPMREPPAPQPILPFIQTFVIGVIVAAMALAAAAAAHFARSRVSRAAQAALAASRAMAPGERLTAQAALLRRLVRVRSGEAAARAEGSAWLAVLDRTFATTFFTDGPGSAFGDSLYRRGGDTEVEALDRTLSSLIAKVRR